MPAEKLDTLLQPDESLLKTEAELKRKGFIPERWQQIEQIEALRITTRMGQSLHERKQNWSETEIVQRRDTVARYFKDLMLEPSFEGGSYASERWLNLFEMIPRIIDMKADENIVPDVDGRVPFKSLGLEKSMIIGKWLINQIQSTLADEQKLSDNQLNDCFTNITPNQLNTVVEQIAQSGLTLLPESPKEHWRRISNEFSAESKKST